MDQQNQQPAKSSFDIVGTIVKILPILSIVFAALAVLGFLFNFVTGIIDAIAYSNFWAFVDGLASGIMRVGFNVFAAAVLAGIAKLIAKKQD